MTVDRTELWTRRRPDHGSAGGFTLIEIIVVMVLTAIVAAVTIPSLGSLGSTRSRAAARMIARDVTYARERAVATGTRTWVVFNAGTKSYSVLGENPASPGRIGALALPDPASPGRTFVTRLGTGEYAGVGIVSATFNSGSEVGFDWVGKPLNNTGAALSATGTVTLTNGCSVTVQPGTGLASYVVP